jgi:hypothetical protein
MPMEGVRVDLRHRDPPEGQIVGMSQDGIELFFRPILHVAHVARRRMIPDLFDCLPGRVQKIHVALT